MVKDSSGYHVAGKLNVGHGWRANTSQGWGLHLQENRTGEECFGHGLTVGKQTGITVVLGDY